MFGETIHVEVLQGPQNARQWRHTSQPATPEAKADLKIDQVGATVLPAHDVLALVQIDIGDAAGVRFFKNSEQLLKELITGPIVGCERAARDVLVRDGVLEKSAGSGDGAAFGRNSADPGESA